MIRNCIAVVCIILLTGCFSLSKDMEQLGQTLGTAFGGDVMVVSLASAYHAQHGEWPQNVDQLMAMRGTHQNSIDEDPMREVIDLGNVKELYTDGEGLVIGWEVAMERSSPVIRRLKIEPPASGLSNQYSGHYIHFGSDNLNVQGTFTVDVAQTLLDTQL